MRCSGLLRDFGHRVKSVSASSFTPAEIKALEEGGNAIAAKKWLATWNGVDVDGNEQVKEFMKQKYVTKRYYKEVAAPSIEPIIAKPQTISTTVATPPSLPPREKQATPIVSILASQYVHISKRLLMNCIIHRRPSISLVNSSPNLQNLNRRNNPTTSLIWPLNSNPQCFQTKQRIHSIHSQAMHLHNQLSLHPRSTRSQL